MPALDRDRFIYSLAGALLSGPWTAASLRAAIRDLAENWGLREPRDLATRTLAAFTASPDFTLLADFLRADRRLERALRRHGKSGGKSAPARAPGKMGNRPPRLRTIFLPALPTEGELAAWFGVKIGELLWRADVGRRNRKQPAEPLRGYRYRWIAKRNGLPRLLEIPKRQLKGMQRRILEEILNRTPPHEAAHGFRAGRSIVTNAAAHCGKPVVLKFDLVDFFASITAARVFRIFWTLGYPQSVSRLLTALCTTALPADVWERRPDAQLGAEFEIGRRFMTPHMPQGAPTSPALANLAALRLDRRLSGLASAAGATYTRYADDLTFSGEAELSRARKRIEVLVAVIAREEGFSLNHHKSRIMRRGVRQQVTGLVVNVRPNVRRSEFDSLKAILTNCARHGAASQNRDELRDFRSHLLGKVSQVASVHVGKGKKLMEIFHRIQWETEARP